MATPEKLFRETATELRAGKGWQAMVDVARTNDDQDRIMNFTGLGIFVYGAATYAELDVGVESFAESVEPPFNSQERYAFETGVFEGLRTALRATMPPETEVRV